MFPDYAFRKHIGRGMNAILVDKLFFVKRIYHNTLANILVEGCIEILVENILPEEIITTTVRKLTGRVLCHNPNSKI
jgi:hypothetical protein